MLDRKNFVNNIPYLRGLEDRTIENVMFTMKSQPLLKKFNYIKQSSKGSWTLWKLETKHFCVFVKKQLQDTSRRTQHFHCLIPRLIRELLIFSGHGRLSMRSKGSWMWLICFKVVFPTGCSIFLESSQKSGLSIFSSTRPSQKWTAFWGTFARSPWSQNLNKLCHVKSVMIPLFCQLWQASLT